MARTRAAVCAQKGMIIKYVLHFSWTWASAAYLYHLSKIRLPTLWSSWMLKTHKFKVCKPASSRKRRCTPRKTCRSTKDDFKKELMCGRHCEALKNLNERHVWSSVENSFVIRSSSPQPIKGQEETIYSGLLDYWLAKQCLLLSLLTFSNTTSSQLCHFIIF